MEYKKTIKYILIFSITGIFLGLAISNLIDAASCSNYDFCSGIQDVIGVPMFLFSVLIFFLSVLLYFLQKEIFYSWFRFSKRYIPLSFLAIFLSLYSSRGDWLNPFETEFLTWVLAGVFFFVSVILIFVKSLKLRSK
jgi:hypothetical protein